MNNEKAVKKLAEVVAFCHLFMMLNDKTDGAYMTSILESPDSWDALKGLSLETHVPSEYTEVFTTKVAATTNKVQTMMNTYIGDEWDNPVEILEWSGFHLGAAIVHLALVQGYAKNDTDLLQQLTSLKTAFETLLAADAAKLQSIAEGV